MNNLKEIFGEPIFCYSRQDALEDGVLHDLSELAEEAGFTLPLAVTASVWSDLNDIPADHSHESVTGRAWDMLVMALYAVRRMREDSDTLSFTMILHTSEGRERTYKMVCGPGDAGEAVMTIMQTNED